MFLSGTWQSAMSKAACKQALEDRYRTASKNISENGYWMEMQKVTKWLLWNRSGTEQRCSELSAQISWISGKLNNAAATRSTHS